MNEIGNTEAKTPCSELIPSDIEGTPEEIIRRLAGRELKPTNGWGRGVVVGAWKLRRPNEEPHVRLLLALPSANNPAQLLNEDARDFLPNSEHANRQKAAAVTQQPPGDPAL